jgi:hypothetical chaperone protein
MRAPVAYGIDFGSTNSAISIAYDDAVEVLSLEQEDPKTQLPSIVYLHRDGIEAAGSEAVRAYLASGSRKTRCGSCSLVDHQLRASECRQYRPGSGCNDARLMSGLKAHLSDPDLRQTHSWARDFTIPDLVAVILRRLKRAADRHVGLDVRRAVVGHPVNFPGTEGSNYKERQELALDRLVDAAERSGFEEVSTFPEPAAALVDEQLEEGTVLALDFGGGTFDAALVVFRPEGGTVVALQGADIGGELFNAELFEAKVAPFLGLAREVQGQHGSVRIPAYIREQLRTMAGAKYLLSDPVLPAILRDLKLGPYLGFQMLEEILYGGHLYSFYRAIEDAKIRLSSLEATTIELHRPRVDLDIPVTREEFEASIARHIEVVRHVVDKTLQRVAMTASDVDLVIRTGGSSNMPIFIGMLTRLFGPDRVQARHSFDSVAHGLGSQAQLLWAS